CRHIHRHPHSRPVLDQVGVLDLEFPLMVEHAKEGSVTPHGVVTGASRGIGRAIALAFAQRGARLTLLGRASTALTETQRLCAAHGAECELIACDVAVPTEIDAAVQRVLAR